MIGFSGWLALVLSAVPRCLSSRKCMRSSPGHARHLLLLETPQSDLKYLRHRLWGHVQRAHSVWGMDRPPSTLVYQLPRVISAPCLSQRALTRYNIGSDRTTSLMLLTSTDKVVCTPVACCNSPATSSFGVRQF